MIAGGINSFVDSGGDAHSIFMGWGNVDIDQMTARRTAAGRKWVVTEIPVLPPGQAVFEFVGDPPAAGDRLVIQSLHDLYNDNLARLQLVFAGRERARLAREADLKANPPQPKDITVTFWRTETPVGKGGRP